MESDELRVSDDVQAASWIAPRLKGEFGAVTLTVPSGYPAYVRICHPAPDHDGPLVKWSDVAADTGRRVHPLMQWHALVGSRDYLNMRGSLWRGSDPERGNLVPEVLVPLCELLGRHSTAGERCCFCVWEGYGWSRLSHRLVSLTLDRSYLLFTGPLAAAPTIGAVVGAPDFAPQSPNLFWPADRAWCVASEIDFDSTLIGGTIELVEAVLEAPTFDAWRVGPDDSLAYDADLINIVR